MTDINLLQELEDLREAKPKSFNAAIIVFCIYIVAVTLRVLFGYSIISGNDDWKTYIILMTFPMVGLLFFSLRRKIGWIISLFYYQSVVFITVWVNMKDYLNGWQTDYFDTLWVPLYLFLLLVFLSICFLLSKGIRRYFRIDPIMTVLVITVSAVLIMGLMIFVK